MHCQYFLIRFLGKYHTPTSRRMALYHGSDRRLSRVEPRWSRLVGKSVVYATPDRWLAVVFGCRSCDAFIEIGFEDGRPYIEEMVPGGLDDLRKCSYVHRLGAAPQPFVGHPALGMPDHEYVAPAAVPVLEVEEVPDALQELRDRHPEVRIVAYRPRATSP